MPRGDLTPPRTDLYLRPTVAAHRGLGKVPARRLPAVLILLAAGLGVAWTPSRAQQEKAPGPQAARFAYLSSASLYRGVNRNDATAAIRAWIDLVGRKLGYVLDINFAISDFAVS